MKESMLTYIFLIFICSSYAQNSDVLNQEDTITKRTNARFASFQQKEKHLFVRDNIVFYMAIPGKAEPGIENDIRILEEMECKAILKRDTATLIRLWARDFTNDGRPLNHVVPGKNPLPYYVSFSRMVEHLVVNDSVVYTSGIEVVWPLEIYKKLGDPFKRNFSHMWLKKYGTWKLVTKYISDAKN